MLEGERKNMELEQALKLNNGFANEWQKALANIMVTYFTVKNEMSLVLEPCGITFQQYNVLRILRGNSPDSLTNGGIQERMLDKQSDVSRMVGRLII